MRAAVIGTHWGRVHVAALRQAGVEVAALAARDATEASAAAQDLDVPVATRDLTSLSELDLDLITVATPAATHLSVIRQLPDVPVLCEKPAVGLAPPAPLPASRTQPVFVNYAFAFLDVAQRARAAVAGLGTVLEASVSSAYDLPDLGLPAAAMWFELVPHPWSWLVTLLGAPAAAEPGSDPPGVLADAVDLTIGARCGDVPLRLTAAPSPGLHGIRHRVLLRGSLGRLELTGRFRVGEPWRFDAPRISRADGTLRLLGKAEAGHGDPWYRANARAIAAVVAAVRGEAPSPLLFSWERALALDLAARPGLLGA
ncbi:MAG TPA: Gfo/Idh/MocA family oxidoreductase [Candidatus Nanopelagicales bacterium]